MPSRLQLVPSRLAAPPPYRRPMLRHVISCARHWSTSAVAAWTLAAAPLAASAVQGPPDRAEPPAPWSLREEFDPDVLPGFAAWFQRSVDRLMEEAVDEGVTPGAYVVVGHGGEVVFSRGYGRVDRTPGAPAVDEHTIWDLASVTKAAATTLAAMVLVEDGRLDLDAPVQRYLEGWPREGVHARLRIRHLLDHTSGLPAGIPPERAGSTSEEWIRTLAETPLEHEAGEREVYSDLGPILMGFVVEAVTGEPFDRFVARAVYRPLGLQRTTFRPLDRGLPAREIAPTEELPEGHLRGVVHDPSARALGGVAGNAGLFASAEELAVLASALLWEVPARIVCRDVLRTFSTRNRTEDRFGLGWSLPGRVGRRDDDVFTPSAFGHEGFTGTSLWIDPEQDLFVLLLTSRLNPTSANYGHAGLRRDLHDVVGRAHMDEEAAEIEADWRIPRTWRGVDGCGAEAAMEALGRLEADVLAPLIW